ncbi:MAG: transcription antitermination factor NusB [Acidobacteria bacterium]|nr:transcription antitermination factor NusB [Acidobacteriota bacterium]
MARRKSRERALQVLFAHDLTRQPVEEATQAYYNTLHSYSDDDAIHRIAPDAFMEELVRGTLARLDDIDARITAHAANWRIDRLPNVERNILRLGVYELLAGNLAQPVVLDEAIELARRFAGEESVRFINGVLDAVGRELRPSEAAGKSGE